MEAVGPWRGHPMDGEASLPPKSHHIDALHCLRWRDDVRMLPRSRHPFAHHSAIFSPVPCSVVRSIRASSSSFGERRQECSTCVPRRMNLPCSQAFPHSHIPSVTCCCHIFPFISVRFLLVGMGGSVSGDKTRKDGAVR